MRKECTTCGGTGQIGFFQGVSRFLLSWEECPHCCGTGFTDDGKKELKNRKKKSSESNIGPGKKKR